MGNLIQKWSLETQIQGKDYDWVRQEDDQQNCINKQVTIGDNKV